MENNTGIICHICILATFNDNFGYQDNILPKYHAKLGYKVYRFINTNSFVDGKMVLDSRPQMDYTDNDGVTNFVFKISNSKMGRFMKKYEHIYERLTEIKPDIIFIHGPQTISVMDVIRYKKKNPQTKIFADNHGDFYNMPIDKGKFLSILNNRYIARYYAKTLTKHIEKLWGVTPWREHYLHKVYNIPHEKTGLLIMGGDDDLISFDDRETIRKSQRKKYGISEEDFVIITGGKIDRKKNVIPLMHAIESIEDKNIKLVIFGAVSDDLKEKFDELVSKNKNFINIGWQDIKGSNDWFLAADLAFFPGTHSVLWEQAVACGIPCVFKRFDKMNHVDTGGNCKFLNGESTEDMKDMLLAILKDGNMYAEMKRVAVGEGRKEFLYSHIAKKSIGLE